MAILFAKQYQKSLPVLAVESELGVAWQPTAPTSLKQLPRFFNPRLLGGRQLIAGRAPMPALASISIRVFRDEGDFAGRAPMPAIIQFIPTYVSIMRSGSFHSEGTYVLSAFRHWVEPEKWDVLVVSLCALPAQ
jgi:hypothetical protein